MITTFRRLKMNRIVMVIVALAVLIGFPVISPAGDASFFHTGENWYLRAYTTGTGPYKVMLEVLDAAGATVTTPIAGLTGNPHEISASASAPDVTLAFDPATSSAYVSYTTTDANGDYFNLAVLPGLVSAGPHINANQNPLAFGSVNVGSNLDKTLTVSNSGNADLTLGTINISGSGFSGNGGTCSNGKVLTSSAPGNSCTVIVKFTPATAGAFSGTLSVTSDDPNTPMAVSLTGTGASGGGGGNGVDLLVSTFVAPKSVDNGISFPLSVTIKNQGTAAAGGFTVKGYFSVDTVPGNGGVPADKLLFTWNVSGLAAGATASSTFSGVFNGFPIHKSYYIVMKVDADSAISETNEGNNIVGMLAFVSR
jgi:hypothetical protein